MQLISNKNNNLETQGELQASLFYCPQNSWVEISTQALLHNVGQYKNIVPKGTIVAPVIKGNAYGHGLLEVATILNKTNLVDYLCVVSIAEAVFLRSQKITKPLLVLSILDASLEDAITHNIDLVLYDLKMAETLDTLAQKHKTKARVHIKIDTGLSRLGVHYTHATKFINTCLSLSNLHVLALFSHYIDAEDSEPQHCPIQQQRFNAVIKQFPNILYKHFSCSAALSRFNTAYNFARFGIGLYGLWPSIENKKRTLSTYPHFSLKPVLTWKTTIMAIKKIPPQSSVGYNATFTTLQEIVTAVLPVGYWDGYNRKLSNQATVKINNQYAPIIGRIAMNMIVVDITNLKNVKVGDTVTLLESDPKISAEKIADQCDTINYEITTRINPLLKRIVV